MGKVFSWVVLWVLGFFAYRLMRLVQRRALAERMGQGQMSGQTVERGGASRAARPRELMRQCDVCGTHVPDGEAWRARGRFFCCAAHRDQAT